MPSVSWRDAIVDQSNLWFNAIEMENQGLLLDAAKIYLDDSRISLERKSLVRAALDCSCAAKCLSKSGNHSEAHRLHFESALLYEENANSVIDKSVRECLWSFRMACKCYGLAGDLKRAKIVSDKVLLLVKRIDPFIQPENLPSDLLEDLIPRSTEEMVGPTESPASLRSTNMKQEEVIAEVQNFIALNRSRSGREFEVQQSSRLSAKVPPEEEKPIDQRLVNQLG
ncbi:MAG TPA: hypothetical protein VFF30_01760 [Nitrososphaerales archaeon]|nr:hypothetical protein [Nitrososphaerales archaeon]